MGTDERFLERTCERGQFVMPERIERGELEFVLSQYRQCWDWAMGDGRATWREVFDTRWSRCHQWSGCPTWQLSRYLLGRQPRYDPGHESDKVPAICVTRNHA